MRLPVELDGKVDVSYLDSKRVEAYELRDGTRHFSSLSLATSNRLPPGPVGRASGSTDRPGSGALAMLLSENRQFKPGAGGSAALARRDCVIEGPILNLASLEPLFKPRSIAVIGASTDPKKISGRPVRYLKTYFRGPIYPVNPRAHDVQGLKAFAAVGDLPEHVDQAIICLSAHLVVPALEACAARGIKAATVFSSGFAEIGEAGRDVQNRIRDLARATGMRVLGPNCMGVMNLAGIDDGEGGDLGRSISTFTIAVEEDPPKAGPIGIVSQSGAFAAHAYTLAARRGLGLSCWATTGNGCDVEFADCLAYLANDAATRVIMGYMEGCEDRVKLFGALELARANRKPVVIVKVGASHVGRKAAASHTAVLSGDDQVFEAVFRRYGVHRARTIDEFFDVAYACSFNRFPRNRKIGIASISGGVGILMADRAVSLELDVAPMPDAAARKLKALLPFAGVDNPVDMTAQIIAQPELLQQDLEAMLAQGGYGAIVVFLTNVFYSDVLRRPMFDCFASIRRGYPDATIALCTITPEDVRSELEALGYFVIDEPTRVVDAVAALVRFERSFSEFRSSAPASGVVDDPSLVLPVRARNEFDTKQALARAGFPVAEEKLVATRDAAAEACEALGYPVALKIASPDIPHKSEIGGVVLGLDSVSRVEAAFDTLMTQAQERAPLARIDGVVVARMAPAGVETILGTSHDPVFGPVVMFGLGGVFVEVMRDVTWRVAPFDVAEARRMIGEIKAAAVLDGVRGQAAADKNALARALARLSDIAAANADTIHSIDINPFIVLPDGNGALAVDALIVPRQR